MLPFFLKPRSWPFLLTRSEGKQHCPLGWARERCRAKQHWEGAAVGLPAIFSSHLRRLATISPPLLERPEGSPATSLCASIHPRKASALSHLASSHINLSSSRLRPPQGAQREEPSSVSLPPRAKAPKHPSSHRSITPAMCCSNICISVATKARSSPTCSLKVILCHLLPQAYTLLDFGTA